MKITVIGTGCVGLVTGVLYIKEVCKESIDSLQTSFCLN